MTAGDQLLVSSRMCKIGEEGEMETDTETRRGAAAGGLL